MQNIDSDLIRGNIDTIILRTLFDGDKYGLDIIKEVETRSNGTYELKQPTLYSCLKRLENQGLISSYWVDSDIGGKRHYYKLTDQGHEFFEKKHEEWAKSKFIIDNLLGNFDYDEYRLVKKDDYDKIIEGKATGEYDNLSSTAQSGGSEYNSLESTNKIDDASATYSPADEFNEGGATYETADKANNGGTIYGETNHSSNESYDFEDAEDEASEATDIDLDNEDDGLSSLLVGEAEEDAAFIRKTVQEDNENLENLSESEDDYQPFYAPDDDEQMGEEFQFGADSSEDDDSQEQSDNIADSADDGINYITSEAQEDSENDELISLPNKSNAETAAQENNILSMLRMQENEEINTYFGDKKSYVNQLNFGSDEPEIVQQNLLDSSFEEEKSEVDKMVEEFENNIKQLNNFDSSGANTKIDDDLDLPEMTPELETNFEQSEEEPESDETFNFSEFKQSESFENEEDDFEESSQNALEIIENTEQQAESNNISLGTADSDYLDELNALSYTNDSKFVSDLENKTYEQTTFEDATKPATEENAEEEEPENSNDSSAEAETFSAESDDVPYNYPTNDYYEKIQTDDKIYTGTSEYYNFVNYPSNYNSKYSGSEYRKRIDELSTYTKTTPQIEEASFEAKDINELKSDFEKEGIEIRTFKKHLKTDEADKTYLLINKLNLIKSLILMFGYVFILSALFVILNSTSFKNTYNFSFTYFIYGFIPLGIYAIYRLVRYLINPYKKVPAKYACGIMIFISVIITVQLLLITYCVNLQLGFYSFTQESYNHLLWLIPTIVSFAPILSTLIFTSLFYSRNFNV